MLNSSEVDSVSFSFPKDTSISHLPINTLSKATCRRTIRVGIKGDLIEGNGMSKGGDEHLGCYFPSLMSKYERDTVVRQNGDSSQEPRVTKNART